MPAATDQDITALATARWATTDDTRLAEIMPALVRHLHALAREVELTEQEWATAMAWLTRAGQISDDKRAEFILASDVLGLSMLVVEMNHHRTRGATPATVLGPFHIADSPHLAYAADMAGHIPGIPLYLAGTVRDVAGEAVAGAVLDVWHADPHGLYEAQVQAVQPRLRGRYTSRRDGSYCVRTVAPVGYSIPMDGPVGDLVSRTGVSPYRPAHLHFLVSAPGYESLTTHLFEKGAPYLHSDAVFGTKPELVVPFDACEPGATPGGGTSDVPWIRVDFDFVLQPTRSGGVA
ncbi:hydroxyquinol 1,2-dioxygenase [Mycolicibacterium iranicum]|uniref:Hydroxyquinol 1,2-dioxygenase n=1 Tax=Mycolicibacterium iranicum TaxID=912594 RepID=A0A839Q7N7_MYCIR|nr:dioxygenase [Mycolicibacterium iranicum]MBB2988641.1 hydroxyquinol 1,2-dioxygenase [Mycolicibacterium iranicum]